MKGMSGREKPNTFMSEIEVVYKDPRIRQKVREYDSGPLFFIEHYLFLITLLVLVGLCYNCLCEGPLELIVLSYEHFKLESFMIKNIGLYYIYNQYKC